jgi:hypothetical protein
MMDNHFHLVVQTLRANLSEFMRRFNICYTSWFHYHHKTCGHLYQGRYKALLVDANNYLLELSRYVHLNPVRVGKLIKFDYVKRWDHVNRYRWSSLPGYINKRLTSDLVYYDMTLKMIGSRRSYQRFLAEGLKTSLAKPHADVQYQTILGDNDFVARVKSEYVDNASLREQPMYRDLMAKVIPPDKLMASVASSLGVEVQTFSLRLGDGINRGIVAELLYRYSDLSQQNIGNLLGGINYTAVSMLRSRLKKIMSEDEKVKTQYVKAERSLRTV